MSDRLAATIGLYAVFCAGVLGTRAALAHERGPLEFASIAALELALAVQAAAVLIAIGGGDRPVDGATFGGYLAASLVILPLGVAGLRDRSSRWDGIALALLCLALAVVVWRLDATWAG